MKNSKEVQQAIRSLLDTRGWVTIELAQRLGLNQSTVSRWASGAAQSIRPEHWSKLSPLIADYLVQPPVSLSEYSTDDIIAELRRRTML